MSEPDGGLFPSDKYLIDIVRTVNAGHIPVAVTLLIGGSVVTGRIAGIKHFNDVHAKAFAEYTTVATEPPETPQIFYMDAAQVNGKSVNWLRVRIASVDGFRLGN
jgi:hypothetical protein